MLICSNQRQPQHLRGCNKKEIGGVVVRETQFRNFQDNIDCKGRLIELKIF